MGCQAGAMMPRICTEQRQRVMAQATTKRLPAGPVYVVADTRQLDDLLSAIELPITRHIGWGPVRAAHITATARGLRRRDRRESPRGRQTD